MEPFLQAIVSFPTLPLTVLLGIVVGYWAFALVTGAAFEAADGAADAAAGGIKAAGDAAGGAVKGGAEAVAGALKGASEAVAGSIKAVGESVAGSVDSATDAATEAVGAAKSAASDAYEGGGLLALLGVGRVPVTMTMSAAVLFAWTFSTLLTLWLAPAAFLTQAGVLGAAGLGGLLAAAAVLRPFGKALGQSRPARRTDSLGQICTITSGKVDGSFGTAQIDDGGAGLNVHVVCSKPNTLKKGDRALLVEFDAAKEVYEVEPVDWLLPQEIEALNDPARAAHVISGRVRRR
jgi:hypothetical protein